MREPLPDSDVPVADRQLALDAFDLVDVPVAWCDAAGRWQGGNQAFLRYTGLQPPADAGQPLPGSLLQGTPPQPDSEALARLLCAPADAPGPEGALLWTLQHADGRPLLARLSLRRLADWQVLTLQPLEPLDSHPRDARPLGTDRLLTLGVSASELMAEAEVLLPPARFGTWSHDLRSGAATWDEQVMRFWERAPGSRTPTLDEALERVVPEERESAARAYRSALRRPGRYTHRLRLVDSQGRIEQVRLLWQVHGDAQGRPERVSGTVFDDTETLTLVQRAHEAQAQLNLVLALADIAIWEHDSASGRLRTSALGWALLGLAPQPGGLGLAQLADRMDGPSRHLLLMRLALDSPGERGSDAPADMELRCRLPDGRWRMLLARSVRRCHADGRLQGHVGVMLDLSERFEARQQAVALAHRLEMATAAAGVGVWSMQLGEHPQVHWDEQMRRLHGMAPERKPPPVLADYVNCMVHPDDRVLVRDSLSVLLKRNQGLLDLDLRITRPDGQVRRLATRTSVSGTPGQRQLHGVMLDVTERYATEAQLRQANERAALATRGAGIGTWELEADADAAWWDGQMFHLFGRDRPPGMVPLDQLLDWLHPADRDLHERRLRAAIRDDVPTNTEFRIIWPDGTVRWLGSRSSTIKDDSGRLVRRIGINWDITDARHAIEARQERLIAQREHQAKARFLARISHELRTPLNAVLGFSQLLLSETAEGEPPDPATWRSRVHQVHASGEHLLALIDDVLELSSLESGELPMSLQPVGLKALAETSLPLVELLARRHEVTLALGALDGWVLADPVRLRQVLLNLLSNAIKYNRPQGRVEVSAEAHGNWWLLRVHDTGRGIRADQMDHLFEPFNRLGAEREGIAGTGIGLAIVQASMQLMGGSVQVRSEPGVGSTFELALQQVPPPAATPLPAPGSEAGDPPLASAPVAAARPIVLYIEDNEVNMMIVRELVRQRPDLEFEGAVDGGSGLAQARARRPALILLDMQLPDMDGHAVLHALKADARTAGILCIAVSANAMPEDIRRAREAGFDDYWTKPLDLAAFQRHMLKMFGPVPA